MGERPILFNAAMVRAILDGRKTVTRRPITRVLTHGQVTEFGTTCTPGYDWHFRDRRMLWHDHRSQRLLGLCPFGSPGDELWVRETWGVGTRPCPVNGWRDGIECRADEAWLGEGDELQLHGVSPPDGVDLDDYRGSWHPSIHMPRWASRIQLGIDGVGIERVSTISDEEGIAEGFSCAAEFLKTWIDIYGPGVDWAWVVRFSVLEPTP